ncbi:GAF domain-containing protein [Oscillochloris sp. ZM17-4]|uniref:GAF domain-containing protein n=1 Tax=Oscillochloris sp. ZM17-4 TaxID=2866714 RepID=UPI001C7384A4|nr:GAF domain-containing protein [Oscillochloris sp. ZM17-4]MBX0328783.1 GAF domain-containing protein [Oscillochloris sp. ZM17-4]
MGDVQLSSMILDSLEDSVALLDTDGMILMVNAAWRRSAQEYGDLDLSRTGPGVNYLNVCRQSARSGDTEALHALEGLQALLRGSQPSFRLEYSGETAEGPRWYVLRAVPLASGDHRVVVSHEHITDVKRATMQQEEMLTILSRAEAVAHVGSWKWDLATNRVTWSDEMFRIFGVDRATFDGDLDAIIAHAVHPDDLGRVQAANAHVLEHGEPAPLEYRLRLPSGEERVVYGDGQVIRDAEGRPTMMLGSIHDRTDLARAQAALQMDDRRLNALFELSERANTLSESEIIQLALEHAVTLTSSQIGYLHFINPDQLSIQLFTWSKETLAHCAAVYDSHYPIDQAGIWADCVRKGRPVMHNDDTQAAGWRGLPAGHAPLSRHLSVPVLDAEGKVVLVIGVGNKERLYDESDARQVGLLADSMWKIVQRKRAESRLRLQSAALEAAATPMVITDKDGVIEWVNSAYTRVSGYTAEEAIGTNPRLIKSGNHPDSFYDQIWGTIHAGHVWHGEITTRHKDGRLYEEEQVITPVRNEAGEITHFITIKQDISARKQREREQQARARLSAALAAATSRADMLGVIISLVSEILAADAAAIATAPATGGLVAIELAGGGWHALAGQRLDLVPDAPLMGVLTRNQPHFGASDGGVLDSPLMIAYVPLSVSGTPFGALLLGREQPLDAPDQSLLIAITEVASNAINRATLHEETARHLQRMQALHHIDKAISAGIDMDIVLSIVIDELIAQLGVDAITIYRQHHTLPTLDRVASRGFRRTLGPQTVRMGETYAGQIAQSHTSIYRPTLGELTATGTGVPPSEEFTLYYGIPLMAKGQLKGVLELFTRRPFHSTDDWHATLEMFASQLAIALDNADMVERLQHSHQELMHAYDATIEGWSRALDLRDKETEGHTLRVTEMTLRLARTMGVSDDDLIHIRRGALLHDIGKMGVPDQILLKPGPLTDEEWVIMRLHPVYAYEMLAPIAFLEQALAIPYAHHERYDGTGYPRRLKGDQIPLAARIFAVVDVWDALRSDRPYRRGWDEERVRAHILAGAGAHFDPQVVKAFTSVLDDVATAP